MKPPTFTAFVEWDKECQKELKLYVDELQQDTCIFGDIAGFFRPELVEIVRELEKKPSFAVEVLAPALCGRAAMKRKAFCVRHQRMCFMEYSQEHTAGSSCTAHSRQGKKLSLGDKNVVHCLAWCGMRLEIQEASITLENVQDFPSELLFRLLAPVYQIQYELLDPRSYGFLVL